MNRTASAHWTGTGKDGNGYYLPPGQARNAARWVYSSDTVMLPRSALIWPRLLATLLLPPAFTSISTGPRVRRCPSQSAPQRSHR